MRVEELRVGNYVLDWFNKQNPETLQVDLDLFQAFNNFNQSGHEYPITPIPINKESLANFDITSYSDKLYGKNYCFDIEINDRLKINIINYDKNSGFLSYLCTISQDEYFGHEILLNIKYIHQLQNLYFALTGEELKIKH